MKPQDAATPRKWVNSTYLFERLFGAFRSFVGEHDGLPFTSFSASAYLNREEGYKYAVHAQARKRLDPGNWTERDVATGKILTATIDAIELSDSNLVPWQARYGLKARPHHALHLAKDDPEALHRIEGTLYGLYRSTDDKSAFEGLVADLGKKYSLLAYLMFLKDKSRYLPIATKSFDRAFDLLGAQFTTANQCSWRNYSTYVGLISELKDLLAKELEGEVNLLDAHTFAWVLARQMVEAEALPDTSDYKALPESERVAIGMARIGQGRFRSELIAYWRRCAVTGVSGEDFLTASHIRPWEGASTADRHNPFNGLLLSPALNACFDKGYVTFDDQGAIVISPLLGPADASSMGITADMTLAKLDERHLPFLAYHHENVFKGSIPSVPQA